MYLDHDENETIVETQEQNDTNQEETTMDVTTEEETPVTEEAEKKAEEAPKPMTDEEKMMEMYEETFNNIRPGQIIEGIVIDINEKEVLVDIGFKSEGTIPIGEFSNSDLPDRYSKVHVFINAIEDGEGKLKLSKKKADFYMHLEKLKEMYKNRQTVRGLLKRRVKGGMIAEIMGLEAFLPGSQISLKPIPNLDQFIGKESEFKIIKLDEDRRNIIVSRKQVLEQDLEKKKDELRDKIQVNAELDGEVKNITDYGAFIDLGGIDGLLHITDMSYGRIKHPSEMLNIGDKLKVKVIGFDEDSDRVSLGLKQLVPHPWENIEAKYPEGTKVSGKVVNITNYGAFIELEPGVEGLVHVSEMSWTKKINHPNQIVKTGDSINAIVLSVSKEDQRISLGMKQMEANPWLTIDDRYPIGKIITRKIKSITPFGVFVEIEDDIDGLVHISDISWTKRIYHPKEVYRVGQEIEAKVLSIDKALHRIALGVKQMHADPWENLDHLLPVNTEISGTISKLIPKGILVDVPANGSVVEGFVPMSHLAIPRIDKLQFAFDIGEELPLKVIELDTENRRLILSVKAFYFGRNRDEKAEFLREHESRIQERKEAAAKREENKAARKRAKQVQKDGEPVTEETEVDETMPEDAYNENIDIHYDDPDEMAYEEPIEEVVEEEASEEEPVEEVVEEEEAPEEEPVEEVVEEEEAPEEEPVEEVVEEEEAPEEEPVEEVVEEEEAPEEEPVEEVVEEEEAPEEEPVEEVVEEEEVPEEEPVEEAEEDKE